MAAQSRNRDNLRYRRPKRGLRVPIWFCAALILFAILGCSFGIYGMNLAKRANINSMPENDTDSLATAVYDYYSEWSIFHDVGLHYDTLEPLDIECEAAFMESDAKGRVQLTGTIWEYGSKWQEEMERYLELLITELDENGVVWEIGFEPIEIARGGQGRIVSEAQEKWEAFNTSNSWLDDFIRDQINHGGTVMQDYRAGYRYDAYRTRALYLKSLYEFLT